MAEPTPPTGRTTDHANTHANSHAGEHARGRVIAALLASWRIAPDDTSQATARRTAERDTDTMLAALPELAELDRLRGLADWDTPGGAAPEWLVDAVIGFVAPHAAERDQARAELAEAREVLSASRVVRRAGYTIVRRDGFARLRTRVEQAEAERDTAQAAITRVRQLADRLTTAISPDYPIVKALRAALTPPSAPESTEETDHG